MTAQTEQQLRTILTAGDRLDDITRARMWSRIEDDLAAPAAAAPAATWKRTTAIAIGAVAAAAVVLLVVRSVRAPAAREGQLVVAADSTLSTRVGPHARSALVGPAQLELLGPAGDATSVHLDRGTLLAEFTGGAGRSLRIEAADLVVEIVGTLFAVDVTDRRACVAVAHGTVRVTRGTTESLVTDRQELCSGDDAPHVIPAEIAEQLARHEQSLQIALSPTPTPTPIPSPTPTPVPSPTPTPVPSPTPAPNATPTATATASATAPAPRTAADVSPTRAPTITTAPRTQTSATVDLPPRAPTTATTPPRAPTTATTPPRAPTTATIPPRAPAIATNKPPRAPTTAAKAPPVPAIASAETPVAPKASARAEPPPPTAPAPAAEPPPPTAPPAVPAPAPRAPTAEELYRAAERALAAGDRAAADRALAQLVALGGPLADQALYERARIAYAGRAWKVARAHLAALAAIAGTPLAEPGRYLDCRIAVESRATDAERCFTAYRAAYPRSPHDLDVLAVLAQLAHARGGCSAARPLRDELVLRYQRTDHAAAWRSRCPEAP